MGDASSVTCPRCGSSLASAETRATERIDPDTAEVSQSSSETDAPQRSSPGRSASALDPFGPRRALYDSLYAARRSLASGGWFEAASAAAVGFLALLCVGLVFLIAARLQYPNLGAGSNPFSVFTSVVLLALGSLRVPVHVGDLTVTALPLGALVMSAIAVSWAVEPAIRRREVTRLRARVAAGAKIALPFGMICCLAAFVFRFRGGASPTHAGALGALVLGTAWGTVFGALGGVRSHGSLRSGARAVVGRLRARAGALYEGLATGGWMLAFAFLAAAGGGLVWVIAALARGTPVPNFSAGDAVAAFIYVLAFLPNVLVAILAISIGAPLDVGAQISVGGRQIGPLKTISLWDWGSAGRPLLAFGLLLIPIVALVGAGYVARRNAGQRRGRVRTTVTGAAVFAIVLASLSWIGQARLGGGLVRNRGFAVVAAEPLAVLGLAFVWGVVGGVVGWKLAERNRPRDEMASSATGPTQGEAA